MNMALYALVGALGLIIGSFLNVVVFRLHTKKISKGRSICNKCGHTLRSHDLIPVLSFIFLKGRCRYCKLRMSLQYPLVEILTAVIFILLYYKLGSENVITSITGNLMFAYYAFVFSLLIAMSVYDLRHYILPWKIMRIFLVVAFLGPIAYNFFNFGVSLENFVCGFITAFPFWALWYFSKGRLIGFGDVLLMCGIGFLLGISGGFAAIILGFWAGAIFVFLKVVFTGKLMSGKTQIPFGPFLAIGAFVAFILNISLSTFVIGIL